MKAKKWATYITFIFSISSIVCALIAYFTCFPIMYDISLAIFGSALLGFVMSLVEYFAERKNSMNNFLSAAFDCYIQFRKLKYINLNEPPELVLNCIFEEQRNNDLISTFKKKEAKAAVLAPSHKKRDAYIAWIKENESIFFHESDNPDTKLIQIYNQRMEDYRKLFLSKMDMYIELSNIDLHDLSNAYSNLDFLFGNNSIRKLAYNSIYSLFRSYRNKILCEVQDFNLLKEGNGNYAICVQKLLSLNDSFFKIEKKNGSNNECKIVYQESLDIISDRLAEFQAAMYLKKEPEYEEKHPVFSQTRFF
ncbi:MAG: hypothetical protein E7574_06550 [Ruminococcaceae bacterium]|nr:hypothetical protein [Oscillospiraceae bacterium]